MPPKVHHGGLTIAVTFTVALMLTMLPLPDSAEVFRPEWMTMVLIYWVLALPERIGVTLAWLLGLLLDVAKGAVLGQHALALTLVAYFALLLHKRIRIYPYSQQALVVMMLIAFQLLVVLWIKGVIDERPGTLLYWLPALTSALLWPWLFLVLRDVRRRFRVS